MNDLILIIEDEQLLAEILSDYFKKSGYETAVLYSGEEAVSTVKKFIPALIILDLMLPSKSGLDICKEVRTFSDVPIIITTAIVDEIDRLIGLELGADDYICKPYSPREVVARAKAVLRRTNKTICLDKQNNCPVLLDRDSYTTVIYGIKLELTVVEFELLNTLVKNPGRIFNRDQLISKIYKDERFVTDRTIDSHVKKLRKKISDAVPNTEIIHSVYGVGYKFEIDG